MNNIYGPIERDDWNTMLLLKSSLGWMRKEDTHKFSKAIKKEDTILKGYLKRYRA